MDANFRRAEALRAVDRVLKGQRAEAVESELIDFKEEAGTFTGGGGRVATTPRDERSAKALAVEAACMANTMTGGVLVVGVNDKAAGPSAFVGTHLDTEWLRTRIRDLTQPHLHLDSIETQTVAGQRIYLVNVEPSTLEEIRCDGKLRTRHATDCVELTGERARQFLEGRRNYDWSVEPSGRALSAADPAALASAREHYREANGLAPGSDLELVRRLGLLVDDDGSPDPKLNRAGALLLTAYDAPTLQIQVLATRTEGIRSYAKEERGAPLLVAFDRAWELIGRVLPPQDVLLGVQRMRVRPLPEKAVREALVNAVMHRDYRQPRSYVSVKVIGQPPSIVKVQSPGGFPNGVTPDRLLSTPSRPRNPALAHVFHLLGLAEREGVGIDTMYVEMLRDGHSFPVIEEVGAEVICRLPGGSLDLDVRRFFHDLAQRDAQLGEDVRAFIAVTALLSSTPLRPERLSTLAQCTEGEAADVLQGLSTAGVVERLLNRSRSFRFTKQTRDQLASRIKYSKMKSFDEHRDMIHAYLDTHDDLSRSQAAELLGIGEPHASRLLLKLKEDGFLRNPGAGRGRNVRYVLAR